MTKQATYIPTNSIVTIVTVNGGWTTIEFSDGTEKKVRNRELAQTTIGPDCHQPQPQPATTKKEATMEAQAETTEAKKPTPPVREARPAHFVGEVAPGKVAKIKNTNFDLSHYFVSDVKTPTGRRTIDCADDVASRLRGLPIEQVYAEAAAALETTVEALQIQYSHLNVGMQRMNLGNRIRGAAAAKEQAAKKAEAKAAREAQAAEKAAAKEAEAAAKAEEKARKEQEKAEAKAARDAEKAEEKARKEAERAAREAEKAAAKAQKEAERAAKKAEKEAAKAE